jgi:hypothetical protein
MSETYLLVDTMSAKGNALAPIRMGDLVSKSTPKVAIKYMPPSKRSAPVVEKIDMTEKNFPSLGAVPLKSSVDPEKETLSDKIKEKIRLDAIAEELGARKDEIDLWKMTDSELISAGWQRLRLSSAKDIAMNGFTQSHLPGLVGEADMGY